MLQFFSTFGISKYVDKQTTKHMDYINKQINTNEIRIYKNIQMVYK